MKNRNGNGEILVAEAIQKRPDSVAKSLHNLIPSPLRPRNRGIGVYNFS
jgi:hypothetical protein